MKKAGISNFTTKHFGYSFTDGEKCIIGVKINNFKMRFLGSDNILYTKDMNSRISCVQLN